MKDNHFQRDVRNPKGRGDGGAPDLGRVERMIDVEVGRETARPGERRRRSRGMRPGQEKKAAAQRALVTGWSIGLFCMALLILAGAGIFYFKRDLGDEASLRVPGPIASPGLSSEQEFGAYPTAGFSAPTEQEAVKIVKEAMAMRDAQKVTERVRAGQTAPDEIVAFFEDFQQVNPGPHDYRWMGSMNANGLQLEGVLVEYEAEGRKSNRLAMLTPDEHGVWKMDFPAFARQTTPAWSEVIEGGADEIVARVYVSADTYYNGVFNDREWQCFAVASPDESDLFLGYCRRGSAQENALLKLMVANPRALRVVLKLRRPEGAELRQFEIARVLAEDWVESDIAYDGTNE